MRYSGLLVCLLASSPAIAELLPPATHGDNSVANGITIKSELSLVSEVQTNNSQAQKKSFADNDTEGWLQQNGDWYIKGMVTHTRLRCATYQLGIQLGKGSPACLNVEWLTDIHYGTMERQCNSSPVQHIGGGSMPELQHLLQQATCVRVAVKCTGTCEK